MAIAFIAGSLFAAGKMTNALTGGELTKVAEQLDLRIVPKVNALKWEDRGDANAQKQALAWYPLEGYQIGILFITVLFVAYGMAGGLGAAVMTDFVQGILTITFSFLLLPWVFAKIGGLHALRENADLKDGMFDLFGRPEIAQILGKEPISVFYVFMLSLTALAGIIAQPHIMGICGAGKTEFEGRFGFTVGNFIKRICTVAWTFTGLACIVWYLGDQSPIALPAEDDPARTVKIAEFEMLKARSDPGYLNLDDAQKQSLDSFDRQFADELFGRAAYDILPDVAPGLVGLLLASLLAAMMSSCDAQMIVGSGLFTENIYKRYFRQGRSQAHYVWVGRLAALAIVSVALILGTTFTDVIDAIKVIIKTPAAIGISVWLGLVWRRWTSAAVWISSIVAYATWALAAYLPGMMEDSFASMSSLHFMMNGGHTKFLDSWTMLLYLSAGLIAGLIVSYVTPREPEEKLNLFYRVMRTPVQEGEIIEAPCTLPDNPAPPVPKWIDFGCAKDLQSTMSMQQSVAGGTQGWQAPEQMMQQPCTHASDVFSLGLVLFYVVTDGRHALDPPAMHQVHLATLSFPAGAGAVALKGSLAGLPSAEARNLLGAMLQFDPSKRPTIAEVLAHPFFFDEDAAYALLCRVHNDRLRDVHGPSAREEVLLRRHWDGGDALLPWLRDAGGGGADDDAAEILWADVCAAAAKAGKGYTYDKSCVAQLMRLVRNTSDSRGGGHYGALPAALRARLEARPGGLARLVLDRFPGLVLAAWRTEAELRR